MNAIKEKEIMKIFKEWSKVAETLAGSAFFFLGGGGGF